MSVAMKIFTGEEAKRIAAEAKPDERTSDVFWVLVKRERDRAFSVAYHMTGDREAAKDIAQEAFCRAFRALPRFRGGEARVSTWFFRILVNQVKNHRRKQCLRERWRYWLGGEAKDGEPELPSDDPLPDNLASDSQLRRRIAQALERLSPGQRAAFSLVHLEEMTVVEAAEVLGISPGTLKSHLHRALEKLRRDLSDLAKEQKP